MKPFIAILIASSLSACSGLATEKQVEQLSDQVADMQSQALNEIILVGPLVVQKHAPGSKDEAGVYCGKFFLGKIASTDDDPGYYVHDIHDSNTSRQLWVKCKRF